MRARLSLSVIVFLFSAWAGPSLAGESLCDDFTAGLQPSYWSTGGNTSLYSFTPTDGGVRISKSAGGILGDFQHGDLRLNYQVRGNFDVRVSFRNASITRVNGSPGNQIQLNLQMGGQFLALVRSDEVGAGNNVHVYVDPPREWRGQRSTTVLAGQLRVTRAGSTVAGYLDGVLVYSGTMNDEDVSAIWLSLQNNGTTDPTAVTFDDFSITADDIVGCTPSADTTPTACSSVETFSDDFSSGIDAAQWTPGSNLSLYSVQAADGGVRMSKPAGGTIGAFQQAYLRLNYQLSGNFDISVDFRNAAITRLNGSPGNQVQLNLTFGGQYFGLVRGDEVGSGNNVHVWVDPPQQVRGLRSSTVSSGTMRVVRSGATVAAYLDGILVYAGTFNSANVTSVWLSLQNNGTTDPTAVTFDDFTVTADDVIGYTPVDSSPLTVRFDDNPPHIARPPDAFVTSGPGIEACSDLQLPVAFGSATGTDDCSEPTITVTGVPPGGLFPVGETDLTWTATDAAGNAVADTQRVVVACPVGDVTGSASQTCDGATTPAPNVAVHLLFEGVPFRASLTDAQGAYRFDDVRQGTYTVSVDPPVGYAAELDTKLVTVGDGETSVDPFRFTCLLGDLTGQVVGSCHGTSAGTLGATVDVYRDDGSGADVLVASAATDDRGDYRFDDLALGTYSVAVVTPLGYTTSTEVEPVALSVPDGTTEAPAFELACQEIAADPRAMGYWKHQVNVYLTGKGNAQESLDDLLRDIDAMVTHFNQNLVNPVIVYVPNGGDAQDRLLQLQQLLTVNKGGTTLDRAKQQLLALLLNVVSGKISQAQVVSDDGITVSQVITYCHDLIVDGVPSNDATAQQVCETINGGGRLPAGTVPTTTRIIAYSKQLFGSGEAISFGIRRVTPNPARGAAYLWVGLPVAGAVTVDVFDVAGRRVAHDQLSLGRGIQSIRLPGATNLAAGVYLVAIRQGEQRATKRFVIVR